MNTIKYESKYEPRQKNIDFESAKESLMKKDDKMVVKRRLERINNIMECKSYNKYEDIPENKKNFFYGFRHNKTDKIDNSILIGCESDILYEKKTN